MQDGHRYHDLRAYLVVMKGLGGYQEIYEEEEQYLYQSYPFLV